MTMGVAKDYEITSDGITVWINSGTGCNIARFGRMGIDVHRSFEEQQTMGQCLHCTAGPVTADDWETFKADMKKFYGITVSDAYKPKRFR